MKEIKYLICLACSVFWVSISYGQQSLGLSGGQAIKRVDDVSSDAYVEYAVTLSADGKTMIFESNQPAESQEDKESGKYNLFISKLQSDGSWSTPKEIKEVNSYGAENDLIGGPSMTYDGNILYFFAYFDGGVGDADIWYSTRKGDVWSEPTNLGEPINTPYYEGFPSISSDGKQLFFIRMDTIRTDVGNCFQIWKSDLKESGEWGEPVMLPKPINVDCEKAPRIMPDGKTLIFSSSRAGGKGAYDIYQSKLSDGGEWSEPINLSFANTERNDQFAAVSAEGENLYFISKGEVNDDIFMTYIPEHFRQLKNITFQGKILSEETDEPIDGHVQVFDALTTELLFETDNSASDGWYSLVLTEGRKYIINYSGDGFSDYSYAIDLLHLDRYKEINKDVALFSKVRVKVNVFDGDLLDFIDAELVVSDLVTGEVYNDLSKEIKGFGEILLPIDKQYLVAVSSEGFVSETFTYDLTSLVKYRFFEEDVNLMPIKQDFEFSVKDLETDENVDVQIVLTNTENNEKIILNKEDLEGDTYKTQVRDGGKYQVEVRSSKGYSFFSTSLSMKNKKKGEQSKMDVELQALKPNTKLDLKDINFEYNSADLLEDSYIELKRLVKLMKDNPSIIVELAAHTDDKGTDRYNLKLSDSRAQSVVAYLQQFGLPDDRLVPKGYGESQPAFPNDSDENMAKNRRVELRILDIK